MSHRVLVVDDDEEILILVRSLLVKEGFEVVFAQDGVSAMIAARHEDPDAVLLDIALPAGDGFTVLRRLRQAGMTVPIIMLTGRDDDASRTAAAEAGASDYLTKPVDRDRLLASLREQISAHAHRLSAVHCPQCGWAIPWDSLDTDVLEAAAEALRERKDGPADGPS
jgi:two-component system OmpR family response regulator